MNDFSGEIQELEKLKNNYYTVNKKNSILTKNQKFDCALEIVNKYQNNRYINTSG